MLHIIHLKHRKDRWQLLQKELQNQNISEYKIWDGILDRDHPYQGIAKAHKQIVDFARKNKLPSILIAEDDLKFTAPSAFRYFLKNQPLDYDLYLGGIYYGILKEDNTTEDFAGLTLYLIHKRFYNIFLSLPEDQHIDRLLRSKGKFVVCNPFIATQHNGFSDNKKEYCNYDTYIKHRKLYAF